MSLLSFLSKSAYRTNICIRAPRISLQQSCHYLTNRNIIMQAPLKIPPNTIRKRLLSFDRNANNINKVNTLVNGLEKIIQDIKQKPTNTQIENLEKII